MTGEATDFSAIWNVIIDKHTEAHFQSCCDHKRKQEKENHFDLMYEAEQIKISGEISCLNMKKANKHLKFKNRLKIIITRSCCIQKRFLSSLAGPKQILENNNYKKRYIYRPFHWCTSATPLLVHSWTKPCVTRWTLHRCFGFFHRGSDDSVMPNESNHTFKSDAQCQTACVFTKQTRLPEHQTTDTAAACRQSPPHEASAFFCFFLKIYIYFKVGKCLGGKWFFLQSETELFSFLISGDCAEKVWMISSDESSHDALKFPKHVKWRGSKRGYLPPAGRVYFLQSKSGFVTEDEITALQKKKKGKRKRHSFLKRNAVSCWTAAQLLSSETENREGGEEKKTHRLQFLICQQVHPSPNRRRRKY